MKVIGYTVAIFMLWCLCGYIAIWIGVCPYVPAYVREPCGWLFFGSVVGCTVWWLMSGRKRERRRVEMQMTPTVITGRDRYW